MTRQPEAALAPDPFARFFLPGPVAVHPDVMHAMLRPMESHRTPQMSARLAAMAPTLKALFRTTRPVIVATCAATGLKEMAMRCGVRERVLVPVGGLFAERFAAVAERCGKTAVRVPVPYDRPITPDELRGALRAHPGVDAVALVHSETGSSVLAPLESLAAAVRETAPDAMLLVDAVTSLAGSPVETDAWGLDIVLTGSQKALGLPPGLSLAVASERAVDRARSLPARGWYFDLQMLQRAAESYTFPQTPALPLLNALEVQLARIAAEGVEARWARHAELRAAVDRWADHRGWTLLPPLGARSWTVSAIRVPEGLTSSVIVEAMERRGWIITDGLPPRAAEHVRVGHMGDMPVASLQGALDELDHVLRELLRVR